MNYDYGNNLILNQLNCLNWIEGFFQQRASNSESVSKSWRLYGYDSIIHPQGVACFRKGHSSSIIYSSISKRFCRYMWSKTNWLHVVGSVALLYLSSNIYSQKSVHLPFLNVYLECVCTKYYHYAKGYHKDLFWVRYCLIFFRNDLFLFIKKCNRYNYADDNSLDSSSENLSEVLINLKVDGRNAIDWFMKNGMQANPDKFHFMLLSPTPMENKCLIYIMAFLWSPKLLQPFWVLQ